MRVMWKRGRNLIASKQKLRKLGTKVRNMMLGRKIDYTEAVNKKEKREMLDLLKMIDRLRLEKNRAEV